LYILNVDQLSIPKDKLYKTKSEIIADWFITRCRIPLLGKTKDGEFVFMRTEWVEECIKLIDYWYDPTGLF
jgi:hypothetical protein